MCGPIIIRLMPISGSAPGPMPVRRPAAEQVLKLGPLREHLVPDRGHLSVPVGLDLLDLRDLLGTEIHTGRALAIAHAHPTAEPRTPGEGLRRHQRQRPDQPECYSCDSSVFPPAASAAFVVAFTGRKQQTPCQTREYRAALGGGSCRGPNNTGLDDRLESSGPRGSSRGTRWGCGSHTPYCGFSTSRTGAPIDPCRHMRSILPVSRRSLRRGRAGA